MPRALAMKWLLVFVLGFYLLLSLPIFSGHPLNVDVVMVTHSVRVLVETGSLKDIGMTVPFQALRPEFNGTQPYWYSYIGPVLLLYPFFELFSPSDFSFYLMQTSLWAAVAYFAHRRFGSLTQTGIFLFFTTVFGSLYGSIYLSPSQLPVVLLALAVWCTFERKPRPSRLIIHGVLFGAGMHFRPETLFLFVIYLAFLRDPSAAAEPRRAGITVGAGVCATFLLGTWGRVALGGGGSEDHTFYTLGTDIFAKGFLTLSLATSSPLSAIATDPELLSRLFAKIARSLAFSGLFQRNDVLLLPVAIVLRVMRISRRQYDALFFLLVCQTLLNSVVLNYSRYFDTAMFLIGIQVFSDIAGHWGKLSEEKMALARGLAVAVIMWATVREAGNFMGKREASPPSFPVIAGVPRDAFVISDSSSQWLWYAGGRRFCFAPWRADTMTSLLTKFPNAYIVLFKGSARIGEGYSALAVRQLVDRSDGIEVFGPARMLPETQAGPLHRP